MTTPRPWGVTPTGFVMPTLDDIVSDMQTDAWGSFDATLDLSPQTPDGKLLLNIANQAFAVWQLLEQAFYTSDRTEVAGAFLDNLGDDLGVPREGESYTTVFCNLTISAANAPYPAGSLVANVLGSSSQTFSNQSEVTAAMISGGLANGILFEATVIGPTPPMAPGSLTEITTPVTGWTAITNPTAQVGLGSSEEPDTAYAERQGKEIASEGSCNPSATAAALVELGAAQQPPVALSVQVVENVGAYQQLVNGVILPPHTYCVVICEVDPSGWAASPAGMQAIGAVLYANKPAGIAMLGLTSVTISDPEAGEVTVFWIVPTAKPLFISATVVPSPTYTGTFAELAADVQEALVAAALALQAPDATFPPPGQFVQGSPVIGSQLNAVIASVPGVFDVQALTFGFSSGPANTAPIFVSPLFIATVLAANIVVTQGTAP